MPAARATRCITVHYSHLTHFVLSKLNFSFSSNEMRSTIVLFYLPCHLLKWTIGHDDFIHVRFKHKTVQLCMLKRLLFLKTRKLIKPSKREREALFVCVFIRLERFIYVYAQVTDIFVSLFCVFAFVCFVFFALPLCHSLPLLLSLPRSSIFKSLFCFTY